ncbi:MAG: hybrid sensor histidine kinase/response regulator [Campylobacterota bacterium]|nr:hybrid sensor histidine kinase/response regulator [Campylobacterota bacterium]
MINIENLIKQTQKSTILYVEDNKEVRESTLLILEDFFDKIIVAIDGKDGLDKFKNEENIDIVISDINMPIMNGLEMSKDILKVNLDIPILIFSAHNESHYFMDAIKLGIEGYLLKPIDINQFTIALNKTIKKVILKKENIEYQNLLEEKVKSQIEDIEEKNKLLFQNTKLVAMGEMIDAIAHQWKQPLTIISMNAESPLVFFEEDHKINKDNIIESHTKIKQQVAHLSSTIDEFRCFFRPNNNIEKVSLRSILNSISILLKDELISYNVELDILIDNDIVIYINQNDIKHLFINLINNAKDEMAKNNIDIANRIITIDVKRDNNIINIQVKDRGNGIPQHIIPDIFKPHVTTKKDDGGTGIGLYMCKQIVDKYNGDISVKNSSIDNGAVFTIELEGSI